MVVALITSIEGAFWAADAKFSYREKLLFAWQQMERLDQPITSPLSPPPPEPYLSVRLPEASGPSWVPYVLGGREIPEAALSPGEVVKLSGLITPESSRHDPQRPVFIVGESAAFGYPYSYEKSFAALLDARLTAKGLTFLNASQVGSAPGELVPVVERAVKFYHPHSVILYVGNNPWIYWGIQRQGPAVHWRLSIGRLLAHSRAIAAIDYGLMKRSLAAQQQRPALPGKTAAHFRPHYEIASAAEALRFPSDDLGYDSRTWPETKQRFLDAFEMSLTQMVRAAQAGQVRPILLTVPFNYKLCPAWMDPQPEAFDPVHRQEVRAAVREAAALVAQGNHTAALLKIDTALALDPLPPILHYLRGQCLEAGGQLAEAELAYAQCRENVVGHLGSRLSVNAVIRRVAHTTGATLVDLRTIFDAYEHARGRYFNQDLILDDCHPTPLGHQVIADALAGLF